MQAKRFWTSPKNRAAVAVFSAALLSAPGAQAILKIGSAATQNMSCSNGVCTPTAKTAVLNVGDLENLLASGNVTVTTTGAGVQADDIHVNAALAWSTSTLSLEAHRAVEINAGVSIAGLSGLTLDAGRTGALSFGKVGNITFANLSSNLVINGASYTLVGDIKTLAGDIANNTSGNFALANNYDASVDGTYNMSPISNVFAGTFEGLGNAISNLSIGGGTKVNDGTFEALFVEITSSATIKDFGLPNAIISVSSDNNAGATLVGLNVGSVQSCYATGKVHGGGRTMRHSSLNGGLVGESEGKIANSYSAAHVEAERYPAGGLVAFSGGTISGSYATGPVSAPSSGGLVGEEAGGSVTDSYATGTVTVKTLKNGGVPAGGGLVSLVYVGQGGAAAAISNSYATGSVSGPTGSYVGGLLGTNRTTNSMISSSYSTGVVTGGTVGGLIGVDDAQLNTDTYWDTDTSGITNLSQGAGSPSNDPGITGLSTAQFQSGLPTGFDPAIWAEKSNINGGLPYLRTNRPPGDR